MNNVPKKCTSNIERNWAEESVSNDPGAKMPALLMTTSRRPKASSDRRMMIQFLGRYLDDPKQTPDREPVGDDDRGNESAPAWSLGVRGAEEDDHE
jgi:hypothetical protein